MLHRAAESLDPGGHLVVVGHGSAPTWSEHHDMEFATPEELVALIDLDPARFSRVTVESRSRQATGPDGQSGTLLDTVIVVRRDV
ncbi:MAG: hypothetical protein WKF50_11800 [Nocardioides sp.]